MHVARVYLRVSTQGQDLERQESIYGLTTAGHEALLRWPQPQTGQPKEQGRAADIALMSPVEV
jgi:hypothetical protein